MASSASANIEQCLQCKTYLYVDVTQCLFCGCARPARALVFNEPLATHPLNWNGRFSRKQFLSWFVPSALFLLLSPGFHIRILAGVPHPEIAYQIYMGLMIAAIVINMIAQARRLHDVDKPAWYLICELSGVCLLFIMHLLLPLSGHDINQHATSVLTQLSAIGTLLVLSICLKPTSTVVNRYGLPTEA